LSSWIIFHINYLSFLINTDLGYGSLEIPGNSFEAREIAKECKDNLRKLFSLPDNYSVLFNEGGAHLLNSGVPLNLIPEGGSANYLVTGFWGARTHKESRKFGDINLVHELVKGNTKQTIFYQQTN